MKLVFDITPADYMALAMRQTSGSGNIRRRKLLFSLLIPLLLLIPAIADFDAFNNPAGYALGAFAVLWTLFYPRFFDWSIRRFYSKEAASPENANLFCRHEVTVSEEGLANKTGFGASELKWDAFSKWTGTEEHFFLYTGKRQAVILPVSAMDGGQQKALAELFAKHIPEISAKN